MFQSYDYISLFMPFFYIAMSLGNLFQRIPAITFMKSKAGGDGPPGQARMPQLILYKVQLTHSEAHPPDRCGRPAPRAGWW